MKILFPILIFFINTASAQPSIKILESGKKVSIRGLSVVTDDIIWASGSNGSVAKSLDGGNTWTWMTIPGYEKRDFRDIEAFDANTVLIMAVAEPAIILKTKDGGNSWNKVYEDTAKGVFLDAMCFKDNSGYGTVIGDPLPGTNKVYQLFTKTKGDTWLKASPTIPTNEGEAFFASSGTNVVSVGSFFVFVSGGKSSRLYANEWFPLDIVQGKESTGANSIAFHEKSGRIVIVGGDFSKDTISINNCEIVPLVKHNRAINPKYSQTITHYKVSDFKKPLSTPHGYRSCVIFISKKQLLTCGTSGVDISNDSGNNWQLISKESFHVCQKAKKGKAVFLAGGGGRIAKLEGN